MIPTTAGEVQKACHARLVRGAPGRTVTAVSTDTRSIRPGDLFVALPGDNFDGHNFVDEAIAKGAAAVLVEESKVRASYPGDAAVLAVRSAVAGLGDLASACRAKFTVPFIAITGSNGKTTTKEMTAHVLSGVGKVSWAKKSYNNFIGLPLTLFELTSDTAYAVLEMGTSGFGEIARMCDIARPDIGVVTNVGPTHLEKLKSLEGVAAAKAELVDALPANGTAILNADDPWCMTIQKRARCRTLTFGMGPGAELRAAEVHADSEGVSFVTGGRVRVHLSVPGVHNVYNALAATAVCRRLGMDMTDVAARLETFAGVPLRMEVLRIGRVTVVNDAYNANLASMTAAIEEFRRYKTSGKRHFVCGDMLELGAESGRLHRELGERIAQAEIDRLWLFGKAVEAARDAAIAAGFPEKNVFLTDDYDALEKAVLKAARSGDVMLVKGSRGMQLERIPAAMKGRKSSS
jgi:UDP-N-acetylmuramoyl-tripeptide--D-alanyl-D-alanine ligase